MNKHFLDNLIYNDHGKLKQYIRHNLFSLEETEYICHSLFSVLNDNSFKFLKKIYFNLIRDIYDCMSQEYKDKFDVIVTMYKLNNNEL